MSEFHSRTSPQAIDTVFGFLASAFHSPDLAPFALVGGARPRTPDERGSQTRHPQQLDFLGTGLRRHVLVEESRFGLGNVLLGEPLYDHFLPPSERTGDLELIAFLEVAVRLRSLAVQIDLPALAGLLGLRARLEEAGDIQPHIEPHRSMLMPNGEWRVPNAEC